MKFLAVSTWHPLPPDNGSRIRVYYLLQALARRHEVALISFVRPTHLSAEADVPWETVAKVPWIEFEPWGLRALFGFLRMSPRSSAVTWSGEMARVVAETLDASDFAGVVAFQSPAGRYLTGIDSGVKILDEVELGAIHDKFSEAASLRLRVRYALTWWKARRHACQLVDSFDIATVVSAREGRLLAGACSRMRNLYVVPNGVDVEWASPSEIIQSANGQTTSLVYNGALTYSANYDAVSFFLREIWPILREGQPDLHFFVTGSTKGVAVDELALDDRVVLTGYLADIRPVVADASVCVVPLRIGGGTRLKILEAMALGTPVVSTSKGAEGLKVTDQIDICIADDPQRFAHAVERLLDDVALRRRIARAAREVVETEYDWRRIGDRFVDKVETIAEGRGGSAGLLPSN